MSTLTAQHRRPATATSTLRGPQALAPVRRAADLPLPETDARTGRRSAGLTSAEPVPARIRRRLPIAIAAAVAVTAAGIALHGSAWDLPLAEALNTLHVGPVAAFASAVYDVLEPVRAILIAMLIAAEQGDETQRVEPLS